MAMIFPSDPPVRIGIPPGTRLVALLRVPDGWQCWLGIRNPQANPSSWEGTYLLLCDDGAVLRVQNDIEPEDIFHVKLSDR